MEFTREQEIEMGNELELLDLTILHSGGNLKGDELLKINSRRDEIRTYFTEKKKKSDLKREIERQEFLRNKKEKEEKINLSCPEEKVELEIESAVKILVKKYGLSNTIKKELIVEIAKVMLKFTKEEKKISAKGIAKYLIKNSELEVKFKIEEIKENLLSLETQIDILKLKTNKI